MKIRHWLVVCGCLLLALPGAQAAEKIGALGRIAPAGGVVQLAGPPGAVIEHIRVAEDETVAAGAELATFTSRGVLAMETAMARQRLEAAQRSLDKAIEIQTRQIARIESAAAAAVALQRSRLEAAAAGHEFAAGSLARLLEAGPDSYSSQQKEMRQHEVDSARIGRDVARRELEQLEANRDADLALARLELERLRLDRDIQTAQARQQVEMAEAQERQATLRAPAAGTVIGILQHEGERTGGGPIFQLADLSRMVVVAEVFQSDVLRVKRGMTATVTGKSLPAAIGGTVTGVSRVIQGRSKVAEVTIALEAPQVAARLINLEVEVSLAPQAP